jgi:uncharacterized protein (UPF0261 family)
LRKVAVLVAEKLNRGSGPVKFFIPTRGWSSLSVKGADLYEPETDAAFAPALKERLRPDAEVLELDTAFNSPQFAEALVGALDGMVKVSASR